jgi:opacity protein-like surface antigen
MCTIRSLACGAVAAVITAGSAMAADLPIPPVIEHTPEYDRELGGGWYLRGDIGYAVYEEPEVTYGPGGAGAVFFQNEEQDNAIVVGFGAGYIFNDFFRADVTFNYRNSADFYGETPGTLACAPNPICSTERANLTSADFMINAYVDIGHWYGITPYVGAGVGASWLQIDSWRSTTPATDIRGNEEWSFAWSLMAGASIDLVRNAKVDVGYRYVNLGELDTGIDGATTGDPIPSYATLDNLAVHEFRVGLRYIID